MSRSSLVTVLALAGCISAAEDAAPPAPWSHPLAGLGRGPVPLADGRDGPDGRWVVREVVALDHDQATAHTSGAAIQVPVRLMTPEERARTKRSAEPLATAPALPAGPGHLLVTVSAPDLEPRPIALLRAVAEGRVTSREEAAELRDLWVAERAAAWEPALASVESSIRAAGGVVRGRFPAIGALEVEMDGTAAADLRADPRVTSVSLVVATEEDLTGGREVIVGSQDDQLVRAGYDGENDGQPYDQTGAILEVGGFDDDIAVFDESGGGATRVRGMLDCASGTCVTTSSFPSVSDHAQGVAQIVAGDLLDGQDPGVGSKTEQIRSTGMTPEGRLWMLGNLLTTREVTAALEKVVTLSPAAAVANLSLSTSADPHCEGRTSSSLALNAAFEAGILVIKSAGNTPGSPTDCTVGDPGSAIGALVVGAHDAGISGGTNEVRNAPIADYSSMGGGATEGGGRTIVDITGYGSRAYMPSAGGGYTYAASGTSFSAPTISGIALDLRDHYLANVGTLIEEPGVLHAALLLLGDRQGAAGKLKRAFDPLWGAGRVAVRRFDDAGLDSPWGYQFGYTCVGDGEVVTLPVNEGVTLDPDVNALKAVAWWYDARHGVDGRVDDVDLSLWTTGGNLLEYSESADDEKERVHVSNVGGKAVELRLEGYDVTADGAGCGTDGMLVYFASYYEDTDRDDGDGPNGQISAP